MPEEMDWLILGDLNLIRKLEDRNKLGGVINEMLLFNEAMSALGLVELPLLGRKFTWSNKQALPLLERLDWFFTSNSWTLSYPEASVISLVNETWYHCPCIIDISTDIPKGKTFRFENYWCEHENSVSITQVHNMIGLCPPIGHTKQKSLVPSSKISEWYSKCGSLNFGASIQNLYVKFTITLLGTVEEHRDLSVPEWNFRKILIEKLISLLQQ